MAESENWLFNKSALEYHKYMLEQGICTDVTFEVCNNVYGLGTADEKGSNVAETFEAHKYQLICRSPAFHAMLCGELAEKGKIVVDDMGPQAFKQMLNYIYADKVDMKPELAMHILYASKKYLLPGLIKLCMQYIQKDDDNACILYDHSLLFDETKSSERLLLKIKNQTRKCLNAPSLLYIRQSTLSKILDSERLTAPEVDVYSACERWARYQIKQLGQEVSGEAMRKVLGDCVYKIRYPAMKFEDFGTIVSPKGVLMANDEVPIFQYFASKGKTTVPQQFKSQNRFLTGPFTVAYEGSCDEMSIMSCKATFDITCDQNISVKHFIIGEMKSGSLSFGQVFLTCSEVRLDDTICKVKAFQVGNPCKLQLEKNMLFRKNSKRAMEICLRANTAADCVQRNPKLRYASSRELKFVDKKTGLNVSVSASDKMFLLGFTYDYDYI